MILQCNEENESYGLPGMREPLGRRARSSRKESPETVLSRRRGCLQQGQHGHLHYVITWWKLYHLVGLDETKTRALESPESESREKRYEGFGVRDYSAIKIFTTGSLAAKLFAHSGRIRFPLRKM